MGMQLKTPSRDIRGAITARRSNAAVSYTDRPAAGRKDAEQWALEEASRILRAAFSEIIHELDEKECKRRRAEKRVTPVMRPLKVG